MIRIAALLGVVQIFASSACLSSDAPEQPISPYLMAGTYDSSGAWDLSSPLTGDGIAGLVADLMVEKIVELAGVPDALHDEARDRVAEIVYQPVRDHVRSVLPAELLPESGLMGDVGQILANIQTRGQLVLEPIFDNPNRLAGTDVVIEMSTGFAGQVYQISIPDLIGNGAVSIAGSFEAAVTDPNTLAFEPYALEIRLGGLVEMVVREILAIPDVAALGQEAAAALECAAIIDRITGGAATFEITISGETFSVDVLGLDDACQSVRAQIAEQVLGLFSVDTGVSLGGGATMSDADNDQVVDGLASATDYGGQLTSLPLPVPVPFAAGFSAAR